MNVVGPAPTDATLATWVERELVELVEIPSLSGSEHAIVEHLARRCDELGLPVTRLQVEGGADDLLVGWDPEPELVLTAHVDTIGPDWDEGGTARVSDGRVFGLGAQDDKSCVVAALLAMVMAREAGVPLATTSVGVGLCVDEETGGTGSIAMAERLRPRHVLGLEGSELRPVLAEAGFVEVWIHAEGRSVHGALREEGVNAIDGALGLISTIHSHPGAAYEHPLLGRNIPLIWEIRGGQRLNVVPSRCSFHLDWRVNPGGPTAASLIEWLQVEAADRGAVVELVEVVEPFETAPTAPVATALARAIEASGSGSVEPAGMVAWTDAHNFVDVAGSQAVVFGPGHLREAHRADESVVVADIVACARVLAALLADAPSWVASGP